jgi:hypothetical protein
MPSTYSPLKIELPATGEQSGTWGNTTNTNLGTALEEAIVGSANVTFASANVTLTLTDTNATQAARNLRLNLIGTTGGVARTLTVPAIEKLYLVSNNCADAITIGNSTGSGVIVPAGNNMWVYNDGTDVLSAITYITTLNASAISAGTVTTTQVDIASQGDLRLQDTTGGQYVALQAPGTVATSYTLTLPVDDGTNGQALITDGNGVLSWSTAASGDVYGPASSTANGVALFDGTTGKLLQSPSTIVYASNVLSLPTIAPAGNVAFTGTGNRITGDFSNSTVANRVLFQTSTTNGNTSVGVIPNGTGVGPNFIAYNNSDPTNASRIRITVNTTEASVISDITGTGTYLPLSFYTNNAERLRIDTSGNVGIGTPTPTTKLTVVSATNGGLFVTDGTVNGVVYASSGPIMTVGTTSNHGLQLFTNNSQKMVIEAGGNVGIGTSTPTGGGGGTVLNIFGSSAASLRVNTSTVTFDIFTSGSTAFIQTGSNHPLNFRINGTTRMVMDTSGNVGVGTSSSTITDKFTVAGAGEVGGISDAGSKESAIRVSSVGGAANDGGQIEFGAGYGSYTQSYFAGIKGLLNNGSANSTGNLAFYTRNATSDTSLTERMLITSAGDVGIGTTSPTSYVNNGTAIIGAVNGTQFFAGSTTNGLSIGSFASSVFVQANAEITTGTTGATAYIIRTNATERMRITNAGSVGIGTSSPSNTLQVTNGTNTQIRVSESSLAFWFDFGRDSSDGLFQINGNQGSGYKWLNASSEVMRIDSAGNVGIGTNNPAAFTGGSKGLAVSINGNSGMAILRNAATSGVNFDQLQVGVAQAASSGYHFIRCYSAVNTSPVVAHYVNGLGDGYFAGNLLVGTGTTGGILRVFGASGRIIIGDSSENYYDANTQIFRNYAAAERMRIDVNGNLCVGNSSISAGLPANGSVVVGARTFLSSNSGDTQLGGLSGSNVTTFYAGGAVGMLLNASSGGLQVVNSISVGNATPTTSGAGITFPATQSASSNANTLDDYEEGTWTPTDASGAGLTFTGAEGIYTKIGNVVFYSFNVTYPSTASTSNSGIGGFPFAARSSGVANPGSGFISYMNANITLTLPMGGGGTSGNFYNLAGGQVQNLTLSTTQIRFSGVIYT